jgi:hypothetical protein
LERNIRGGIRSVSDNVIMKIPKITNRCDYVVAWSYPEKPCGKPVMKYFRYINTPVDTLTCRCVKHSTNEYLENHNMMFVYITHRDIPEEEAMIMQVMLS